MSPPHGSLHSRSSGTAVNGQRCHLWSQRAAIPTQCSQSENPSVATLGGPASGHDFRRAPTTWQRRTGGPHGVSLSGAVLRQDGLNRFMALSPPSRHTGQGALALRQFACSLPQGFRLCPIYRCPGNLDDKEVNSHGNKDRTPLPGSPPRVPTHGPIFPRTRQGQDTLSSSSTDEENQSHELGDGQRRWAGTVPSSRAAE